MVSKHGCAIVNMVCHTHTLPVCTQSCALNNKYHVKKYNKSINDVAVIHVTHQRDKIFKHLVK